MENNHNEAISNLIESQVKEIKGHISNIDKYLNEGKTAKAFLSLQLIAHTDEMKKYVKEFRLKSEITTIKFILNKRLYEKYAGADVYKRLKEDTDTWCKFAKRCEDEGYERRKFSLTAEEVLASFINEGWKIVFK